MKLLNLKKNSKLLISFLTIPFIYLFLYIVLTDFSQINRYYEIRVLFPTFILFTLINLSLNILKKFFLPENIAIFIVFLVSLCGIYILLLISFVEPHIHFDTWQVYDMSKYVFVDFGRMDMIRQHIVNSPYEMAFPPFFPIAMATINYFFNFGIFSSIVVVFISLILLTYFVSKIAIESKHGLCVSLGLLIFIFNRSIVYCIIGGSTLIPSAMIFCASIYVLLNKKNIDIFSVIKISFLSGLGVMNRFDYLPIALVLAGITLLIKGKIIKSVFLYLSTLFLTISPWILYSKIRFDSWFITDNGRRIWSIPDVRPTSFFSESYPLETIGDNFFLWLFESSKRWLDSVGGFISLARNSTPFFTLLFLLLIYMCYQIISKQKTEKSNKKSSLNLKVKSFCRFICSIDIDTKKAFIVSVAVIGQFAAIILTGYPDERYFAMGLSFFVVVLLIILHNLILKDIALAKKNILIISMVLGVMFIDLAHVGKLGVGSLIINPKSKISENIVLSEGIKIKEVLEKYEVHTGTESRLIIFLHEPTISVPRFSALSNQVNTISTQNISSLNASDFAKSFEMNHIYSSNSDILNYYEESGCAIVETEVEFLYEIIVN